MALTTVDLTTQTAYAELVSACMIPAFDGTGVSFSKKRIKEKLYWYVTAKVGSRSMQRYIGPDNADTKQLIDREKKLWAEKADDRKQRARLVNMVLAGGLPGVTPQEGKIMQLLERAGVFLIGGVLVGTPAFQLLGNQLGVSWEGDQRTQDIDIALDYRLPLAVDDNVTDLKDVLIQSGMGFVEIPALNSRQPSTSFKLRGQNYSVDVLTPEIGPPASKPVPLRQLNTFATPLRFLDYLIEKTEIAVVPFNIGILVNIPDPSRFALHKLVVSQRRSGHQKIKSQKDIMQATQLLEVLLETRPGAVIEAYEAANDMGNKFMKDLRIAIKLLPKRIAILIREWID